MLRITDEATEVLVRAQEAASRLNPDARVRVLKMGDQIEVGLSDEPEEGDEIVEHEGLTVYVAAGIEGTLEVTEEHDRLVVRQD